MLKRTCPRSTTCASIANGSSLTSTLLTLPVKNASSSCRVPRATVPSTSGRELEPSAKKALGRRPRYLGWLCMSSRHAVAAIRQTATRTIRAPRLGRAAASAGPHRSSPWFACERRRALCFDVIDLSCPEALEKRPRRLVVELRIGGFDREEEPVLAGVLGKAGHVEHRVIRHRQPVEDEHAEHRRERREQDRQLER